MQTPGEPRRPAEPDPRADAWKAHRRRQARVGLELTPAERLRWLEDALETLRRWQGRARGVRAKNEAQE